MSVVDAAGHPLRAGVTAGLAAWLAALVPSRVRGTVTVALVSDHRVRILNRTYRGKDYPTDVLSFPGDAGDTAGAPGRAAATTLGDIVIAEGVARRQARQYGHPERTEVRTLALHGLLHLLGYDHEDPADAGTMARIERQWRKKGGLPVGLIDRAGQSHARPATRPAHAARSASPARRSRS